MSIILITGATNGIGLETAQQLARLGHELVLHGRTGAKAARARDAVLEKSPAAKLHTTYADLSSLAEVVRMANSLNTLLPRLDVLLNNAGVYMLERKDSRDGFEMTLAVNHLAHFLLTALLLPLLKKSAELARREPWLTSNYLHPGVIDTKLLHAAFDMTGASVQSGAKTLVYLAISPKVKGISGKYFDNCKITPPHAAVKDAPLAQQLWQWSEQAIGSVL